MMNRWRFFELAMAAIFLVAGATLLYSGSVDRSITAGASLIGGAAFFSLGAVMVVSAVRSFLWHRRMIRHAMPPHGTGRTIHKHRGQLHWHR
jgi:hypothetical protein